MMRLLTTKNSATREFEYSEDPNTPRAPKDGKLPNLPKLGAVGHRMVERFGKDNNLGKILKLAGSRKATMAFKVAVTFKAEVLVLEVVR